MQLQSIKGYNAASWGPDITAHIITQRYAELTTSLLLLNTDYQACPPLHFVSLHSLASVLPNTIATQHASDCSAAFFITQCL